MKKIYFASDFHLGIPDQPSSVAREKKIVKWLRSIEDDAAIIYLIGDLFDYWFEYKHVVPRGYVRLLGTLADLKDDGIDIRIFTGNHDLWMKSYFQEELGIPVTTKHVSEEFSGKKFFIGHGDGIGPGDKGYKFMKRIFQSRLNQWMYSQLHPDAATRLANYFSRRSRKNNRREKFLGEENEWQIVFAKEILKKEHFDYFIFGHRHIPLEIPLGDNAVFINLGDWITNFTYAVFDGEKTVLKKFED